MSDAILVLNTGSSSLKFSLFGARNSLTRADAICDGQVDGIGNKLHFVAKDSANADLTDGPLAGEPTHERALAALFAWLEKEFGEVRLRAVGHRIVHGGATFTEPVIINPDILKALYALVPLAPLHQPHNLAAVDALHKTHPTLPQIACFDTSFHKTQSPLARAFALPRALTEDGIRRYGFHGISYEYIADVLPEIIGAEAAEGRVVVAHLGSGASLCGMRNRRSVATTMGFTALDGLMMARRCGAIDPGVLLYLLQEKGMTTDTLSDLLYNRSGLLGVSGLSDDMRELLASPDARAKEAVDLFVYRMGQSLGSMAAALGGLDALVFTGGIGEHAVEIRRRVCEDARWLGIVFDEDANAKGGPCIAPGTVTAWAIPTDEDLIIARHTWELMMGSRRH